MAKYTTNLKLSVIAHYQSNHSYKRTAKQFNLNHKTVELWVKLYQTTALTVLKDEAPKPSMTPSLNLTSYNKFFLVNL